MERGKPQQEMGKGQIDIYILTSGGGNVFQKISFPRGRDMHLYRAMLVCNQNKRLVLQTLINYDRYFFFFHPRKAWVFFNTRFTMD